jgi:hypothetical protein
MFSADCHPAEHILPTRQVLKKKFLSMQGEDPVYVWLPLPPPAPTGPRLTKGPHPGRLPESAGRGTIPELQLHLRLQWVRQVERGQIMHLDFSLEGCGISVVGCARLPNTSQTGDQDDGTTSRCSVSLLSCSMARRRGGVMGPSALPLALLLSCRPALRRQGWLTGVLGLSRSHV